MAQRIQFLERDLKLIVDRELSQQALARKLAHFARTDRDKYLSEQQSPPQYETFVNGRTGVAEEQVRLPGPIVYRFTYLRPIAQFALDWLRQKSPSQSGAYQRGHFILHNGAEVEIEALPPDATEIAITNDLPYARKLHVGGMKTGAEYIFEDLRTAIVARYGFQQTVAMVKFLDLAGAYRLKRDWGRKGRHKGDPLTYPAVVLTTRED